MKLRVLAGLAVVLSLSVSDSVPAHAQAPDGAGVLRLLGARAELDLAPQSRQVGALVALPAGKRGADYGLDEVAPGIGRLRGSAASLLGFAAAHPELPMEVAPPVHTLLDRAGSIVYSGYVRGHFGADGTGTLVGIADTGLDVTHPDFRDPKTNKSRVAWMLDLGMKPLGRHADLEDKYGIKDDKGTVLRGAVLTGADIDDLIGRGDPLPQDKNGHGSHVASIAAGNGGGTKYIGMAPNAGLVIARVTRDDSGSIENDDSLRGAGFIFDRADAMHLPVAANYSLGTDFGPHDGTSLWEQSLAAFVGPQHPGHILVAAAGNSGSIVATPVHQSVNVTPGSTIRIPVATSGAASGGVQIWATLRAGADVQIGLDGPDGTWISPISEGEQKGKSSAGYNSGVIYGSSIPGSSIPKGSRGAIVLWSGQWPSGSYAVTLSGRGMVELYLYGYGDASMSGNTPAYFTGAVREGTVNLPATSPDIIAVGCTVSSPTWRSMSGQRIGLSSPMLDPAGGLPDPARQHRALEDGEICYFSSAGPNAAGVPKPDIAAPGMIITGAMSGQAKPGVATSIFTAPFCPKDADTGIVDPACLQVDATHAASQGTSMSSPMVAGVAALLLQQDPTLTQDQMRALLQAGAHRFRGTASYYDQAGPGELDADGALAALNEMKSPAEALPSPAHSWLSLSADYVTADGSTPMTVLLELRNADGQKRASLFDLSRLQPVASIVGRPLASEPKMVRGGAPGLFSFQVMVPPGLGGQAITLGATFDGDNIVAPVTVPIATDAWTANYLAEAKGACNTGGGDPGGMVGMGLVALLVLRRRKR